MTPICRQNSGNCSRELLRGCENFRTTGTLTELVGILSYQVQDIWPYVVGHVERFTEKTGGRYSPASVLSKLLTADMQLWIVVEGKEISAAVITQISVWDTGLKSLVIVGIGGDGLPNWIHLIERLEEFGREKDCSFVELHGRQGWRRALPDYELTDSSLEKRL